MKFFGSWIAAAVPWTNYVYPEPYLGQSGGPWGRVFLVDVFLGFPLAMGPVGIV